MLDALDPPGRRRRVVPLRPVRARPALPRHPRRASASTAEHVRFELFTTGEPDRPEGDVGRPVVGRADEDDVHASRSSSTGSVGDGRQPRCTRQRDRSSTPPCGCAPTCRSPAPAACAAPAARGCVEGTVTMDRELRARAGRARARLRPDLPVPPDDRPRRRRLRRREPEHRRSPMIDLTIADGVAEIVLDAPRQAQRPRRDGARANWPRRTTSAEARAACARCCCAARAGRSAPAATSPASTRATDDVQGYLGGLVTPLLRRMARVPRADVRGRARRVPRRRARPADRDRRRLRRRDREDRLAVRQARRDARLRRARSVLSSASARTGPST